MKTSSSSSSLNSSSSSYSLKRKLESCEYSAEDTKNVSTYYFKFNSEGETEHNSPPLEECQKKVDSLDSKAEDSVVPEIHKRILEEDISELLRKAEVIAMNAHEEELYSEEEIQTRRRRKRCNKRNSFEEEQIENKVCYFAEYSHFFRISNCLKK